MKLSAAKAAHLLAMPPLTVAAAARVLQALVRARRACVAFRAQRYRGRCARRLQRWARKCHFHAAAWRVHRARSAVDALAASHGPHAAHALGALLKQPALMLYPVWR